MRLWNDYEGTTIAGAYPIKKLLRPEGRSAFFSTSNGTGTPAVIRLIEAINDEAEILSRWKTVADLQETHLITLKKFGQTIFEGTPLVYVLMEDTEADLASILAERPLTVDETRQIATSLVEAVGALHASGIIHEHIEPMNVLAKGELVKLRSDCIREAPEGEEGIALTKQDVHDLCLVLLQALTQRRSLEAVGRGMLPAPFDLIIRNGMSGTWGLAQIAAALSPAAALSSAAALVPAAALAPPVAEPIATGAPLPPAGGSVSRQQEQMPLALPRQGETTVAAAAAPEAARDFVVEPVSKQSFSRLPEATTRQRRITVPIGEDPARRRLWMVIAPVVIVIAIALGWHFLHLASALNHVTTPPTTTPAQAGPAPAVTGPASQGHAQKPSASSAASVPLNSAAGDAARRWRVVAYTYNRSDQAQHKAEQVAQRDASLRPEVFSPSGRPPFLVTLGGVMTRAEAASLRNKAAAAGLPRDLYIQNYNAGR